MALEKLQLNVPGAADDVGVLTNTRSQIDATAQQLKTESSKLFNGCLLGTGADAGSEFSLMVDSAVNSSNDVLWRLITVTKDAIETTHAFDQNSFPQVFQL